MATKMSDQHALAELKNAKMNLELMLQLVCQYQSMSVLEYVSIRVLQLISNQLLAICLILACLPTKAGI